MSNVLSFVGNVGQDAVVREAGKSKVMGFSVAMNTGFGDKQSTIWVNCSVWGARATEKFAASLTKGTKVFVSGEMSQREYAKKDGSGNATSTELNVTLIEFAGGKPTESNTSNDAPVVAEKADADVPF